MDKSKYLLYGIGMDINSLFSFLATVKKMMFTFPNLIYQHGSNNLIGCSSQLVVSKKNYSETGFSNFVSLYVTTSNFE